MGDVEDDGAGLPDDSLTLEAGWAAFWADARRSGADPASVRQAFKNGAAFVVARGVWRGPAALRALIADDVNLFREMPRWIAACMAVHPSWSEVHQDAMRCGALAAAAMFRGGAAPDLSRFRP